MNFKEYFSLNKKFINFSAIANSLNIYLKYFCKKNKNKLKIVFDLKVIYFNVVCRKYVKYLEVSLRIYVRLLLTGSKKILKIIFTSFAFFHIISGFFFYVE